MTVNKYLKMLGMTNEELRKCINAMSEKEAKEGLYQIVSFMNEDRRKSVDDTFSN